MRLLGHVSRSLGVSGRDGVLGSQLLIFGKPHVVYGRLGRTGVGTHERGVFTSFCKRFAGASPSGASGYSCEFGAFYICSGN